MGVLEEQIKDKAAKLGFDLVGVTSAEPVGSADAERLRAWLAGGRAGEMAYMHRNIAARLDPAALLPGAKAVVCVAIHYKPPADDLARPPAIRHAGRVADFALFEDYHAFILSRLAQLGVYLQELAGSGDVQCRACVDSAPVMERALAARAGLGFIGRHHGLIHPQLGGHLLLGELVTTLELACDKPLPDGCTDCDRCIRACPTHALGFDGSFDARRCISYLTIEKRGEIGDESAVLIGDRVFGCDECVSACPYDIHAPSARGCGMACRPQRKWLDLDQVMQWNRGDFDGVFGGTCVERIRLEGLKRNARACLRNLGGDCGG